MWSLPKNLRKTRKSRKISLVSGKNSVLNMPIALINRVKTAEYNMGENFNLSLHERLEKKLEVLKNAILLYGKNKNSLSVPNVKELNEEFENFILENQQV